MRGYGGSDKPHAIEAYAIKDMAADIAGLIAALGADRAVVVGHDWGAPIAYGTALFHPERVRGVAGVSAPHAGRGSAPSIELYRKTYKDRFFYQLYFQEPGVAEAELEADVRRSLRIIYYAISGEGQKAGAKVENPTAPGWLDRYVDPDRLPPWLTELISITAPGNFARAASGGRSIATATPNAISSSLPPSTASRSRSRRPSWPVVSSPSCASFPASIWST